MAILKAEVAEVNLGHLTFEGLLREDGVECIGIIQCSFIFQTFRENAARDFKRLLGKEYETFRVQTELNPKSIYAVKLDAFTEVIVRLARKENSIAVDIRDQLIGVSLKQLWADAFKIKFEQEQRQGWLKERQESKSVRRGLGAAIKDYVARHENELSENRKTYIYNNVTEKTYCALFGGNSVKLKRLKNLDKNAEIRECLSEQELVELKNFEFNCAKLIDKDIAPFDAIEQMKATFY